MNGHHAAIHASGKMVLDLFERGVGMGDRLVHHSVILELNVPSYRAEQAMKRKIQDK